MIALPEKAMEPAIASASPGHSAALATGAAVTRQKPAARPSRRESLAAT
jgi:hypothetical protein